MQRFWGWARAGERAEGLEGEGRGGRLAAFLQLPESSPSCRAGSWERAPRVGTAALA